MSRFTPDDHDLPPTGSSIRLASGRYIDLLNPEADNIYLSDIAHALSHICRFGGHTATFYSVAEHSLTVSAMVQRQTGDPQEAMVGLLHDAAEAYIGDMVRPLKHSNEMAGFLAIETRVEQAIAEWFGLSSLSSQIVKEADRGLLSWEMAIYRDADWRTPTLQEQVRAAFIARYHDLRLEIQRETGSATPASNESPVTVERSANPSKTNGRGL